MKNAINTKELEKTFQKRNFYTLKDSGNVFLYALLISLAVGIVFAYIMLSIVKGVGLEIPEDANISNFLIEGNYIWYIIPSMLLTQIVFVSLYFCYNKASRVQFKASKFFFKKANIWTTLLSIFVGIICVLGFLWLIEGCFGKLFTVLKFPTSPAIPVNNVGMLFVYLIILGVVPAICEELIFRGVIFQGLRERLSAPVSVILCGLMFALMHQNIQQFIYPFILGCVLSFVMERTGNLLYCILIHMFNNITTVIISYVMHCREVATGAAVTFNTTWWGCLCAVLIATIVIVILWLIDKFYLRKREKIETSKEGELNQTPPIMAGKLPLSMVCGIVFAVLMIVINAFG